MICRDNERGAHIRAVTIDGEINLQRLQVRYAQIVSYSTFDRGRIFHKVNLEHTLRELHRIIVQSNLIKCESDEL